MVSIKVMVTAVILFLTSTLVTYFVVDVITSWPSTWNLTEEEQIWCEEAAEIWKNKGFGQQDLSELQITSTALQIHASHNIQGEIGEYIKSVNHTLELFGSIAIGLIAMVAFPFAYSKLQEILT